MAKETIVLRPIYMCVAQGSESARFFGFCLVMSFGPLLKLFCGILTVKNVGGRVMLRVLFLILMAVVSLQGLAWAGELAPPIRLEAGGKPIDTDVGHAAPWVADFDGDGVQDLLVGQFGDGILWFCRNEGTNAQPRLAAPEKFKQGKKDGRVPCG